MVGVFRVKEFGYDNDDYDMIGIDDELEGMWKGGTVGTGTGGEVQSLAGILINYLSAGCS